MTSLSSTVTLRSGLKMPLFGLGTYTCPNDICEEMCLKALELGYRLLDTAAMYGNEVGVGNAVRKSGIPRDQIFITTKLLSSDHGAEKVPVAFQSSLSKLGLEYV